MERSDMSRCSRLPLLVALGLMLCHSTDAASIFRRGPAVRHPSRESPSQSLFRNIRERNAVPKSVLIESIEPNQKPGLSKLTTQYKGRNRPVAIGDLALAAVVRRLDATRMVEEDQ